MERSSGILMHITSLPSEYGIGTLGVEAYRFADFLSAASQKYWQILPVNPTGFADSPYQSFSTFAGNPYMIDLDMLSERGFIKQSDYSGLDWGNDPLSVDYGMVYLNRFKVLRKAAQNTDVESVEEYRLFCEKNSWWLDDYAIFMAAKYENDTLPWYEWKDEGLRLHEPDAVKAFEKEHEEDVEFWRFTQYLFFEQWGKLKEYVNGLGIKIIGDIPFYVACDSSDVWAERSLFCFDDDHQPSAFAGVPPDFFSEDGQFWGNPVYDWEYMKRDGYEWWTNRLKHMCMLYDVIRVDHFRGFEAFYVIDRHSKSAVNGEWRKGPGEDFFNVIARKLGRLPIIAEDLGFLTPGVHELRKGAGYPGMKVLQFAFDSKEESDYLPHNYEHDCVVYTGTHDNTTITGWFEEADKEDVAFAVEYGALTKEEGYNWGILRLMYESVGNVAIAQMQDFLGLPGSARMNTPSTIGNNWRWRVGRDYYEPELVHKIGRMVRLYGR